MLFLCYSSLVLVPQIGLLMGIPISAWEFYVSILFLLGGSWIFYRNYFDQNNKLGFFTIFGSSLLILFCTLYFSNQVIDSSFDGTWYHQDAIYLLKNGWNPNYHVLVQDETSYSERYLNHFPKSSWIFAALLFKTTGLIEVGKSGTWLLFFSCLFIGQHIFQAIFRKKPLQAWVLAILFACNPILLLNLNSFYVDGQLAALIFLGIAFAIYQIHEGGWLKGFLSLLAFSLLANIKFTSAIYAGIFVFGFLTYLYFTHAYKVKKLIGILILWGVFTFAFLGWNPYMSNLIRHGHPLYPLSEGSKNVFDKEIVYPANFLEMNWLEKFVHGFYAEPSWNRNPQNSEMKTLFGHVPLGTYENGVPDLAGFGPIAPEVFTLLIGLLVLALLVSNRKSKNYLAWLVSLLLISICINPEAWLLRYVPQFWILIMVILFFVWEQKNFGILAMVLAFGLFGNSYLLVRTYFSNTIARTENFRKEVELVSTSADYTYYSGWTKSAKYRFQSMGLDSSKEVYIPAEDSTAKPFSIGLGSLFRKNSIVK